MVFDFEVVKPGPPERARESARPASTRIVDRETELEDPPGSRRSTVKRLRGPPRFRDETRTSIPGILSPSFRGPPATALPSVYRSMGSPRESGWVRGPARVAPRLVCLRSRGSCPWSRHGAGRGNPMSAHSSEELGGSCAHIGVVGILSTSEKALQQFLLLLLPLFRSS